MTYIEMNARLLDETARRVEGGVIPPADVPAAMEMVVGYIRGLGVVLTMALSEAGLEAEWEHAIDLCLQTARLADRWAGGGVSASQVVVEIGSIGRDIQALMAGVETTLVAVYGVDIDPLIPERRQALEELSLIFEGLTTPEP
ncbi:MAG: hypothetical protein AB1449_02460 [Chloroflexota bacterium]